MSPSACLAMKCTFPSFVRRGQAGWVGGRGGPAGYNRGGYVFLVLYGFIRVVGSAMPCLAVRKSRCSGWCDRAEVGFGS